MSEENAATDAPWFSSAGIDVSALAGEGADESRIESMTNKLTELGSVEGVAKTMFEQEKLIGKKGIIVPGENAAEDEKASFKSSLREHLGLAVPESVDGYTWEAPEDLADQFTKEGIAAQLKEYHDAGYTDEQAKVALDGQINAYKAIQQKMQERQSEIAKASESALKEKFGDDYNDRMAGIAKLQERFPDQMEKLSAAGLANDQGFLEMFDEVARSVSEGVPLGGGENRNMSAADELAEITKQPLSRAEKMNSPYYNGRHPDHSATMSRVLELQRKIHVKK